MQQTAAATCFQTYKKIVLTVLDVRWHKQNLHNRFNTRRSLISLKGRAHEWTITIVLKRKNSQAPQVSELLLHFLILGKLAVQTGSGLFIGNPPLEFGLLFSIFLFLPLDFQAMVTIAEHFCIQKSNIFVMLMLKKDNIKINEIIPSQYVTINTIW